MLSDDVRILLRCPVCGSAVKSAESEIDCTNEQCASVFPLVDGIPIMIDEQASIFDIQDFLERKDTFFPLSKKTRLREFLKRLLPKQNSDRVNKETYRRFADMLAARPSKARVLVVGGSVLGQGMEPLTSNPNIELVETDVSFGPRTSIICDAHSIPFADCSFDGVICQAVLEHVVDPVQCVSEFHRVLKDDGLVYVDSPFMQQVHSGRYDFTRFTHLGHRRLLRHFEEIESGPVGGPAVVLAWSYQYFLTGFSTHMTVRRALRAFARLSGFWLRYCDRLLINKPGAFDSGTGYYFICRKSDKVLSDRELVKQYRGAG